MLGYSIQKLLVLAAVIGAVWYGFKFVGRLQQARDAEAKAGGKDQEFLNRETEHGLVLGAWRQAVKPACAES